jgi:hypothetical protein
VTSIDEEEKVEKPSTRKHKTYLSKKILQIFPQGIFRVYKGDKI